MTTDIRPRIFSHLTKTRFLHIEDSLSLGKLRFFIGTFERGKGASSTAYGFMDVNDARVVLGDMSWGKPVDFIDYKGGKDGSGAIISRILKIKTKDERVWIDLQNGVGEELYEGAVKPQGRPFADISIPLTIFEGRKLAAATLAYMQAWDLLRMMNVSPTCAQCPARVKLPVNSSQ